MRSKLPALAVAVLLILAGCSGGSDMSSGQAASSNVGLAAGGAQDANAFRDNVREGYVPQPTDVTSEGLFHDYYFDTGQSEPCDETFCPSYSRAVSKDPLSNETEHYLTVGLNSGIEKSDFEREKLNLVVVVDTSGSMSSEFREYHYDGESGTQTRTPETENPETRTKMAAAKSALETMVGKLNDDDRLGIVAYDNEARVAHELQSMESTDDDRLADRIESLEADGGTNLDAGMRTANLMLEDRADDDRETRIVYLTDAMPNLGDTESGSLESRLQEQAESGIHTTFVGVGIDFNTELTDAITSVRGANYYAVHSTEAFRERMDEGFAHMVTPMVYDLSVEVESEGYRIEQVYGSPEADAATGEVMHVKTLFPSRTTENKTEGGVVLLKLERTGEAETIDLTASYETRDGEERETTRQVEFPDREPDYYETTGIRKAIALSRYADLVSNWADYERAQAAGENAETPAQGIETRDLGEWEQQSVELRVSEVYRDRIDRFESYFDAEMDALGADRMREDLLVLRKLTDYGTENGTSEFETNQTATTTV